MNDRILVAYASKCGSTGEVAEVVGQVLHQAGAAVDIYKAHQVKDISPYRAVVLGTAIRMEKPLSEAISFARKHRAALAQRPVACFSLGVYMREDTPENRAKTLRFLSPLLREIQPPVSLGLFGGKIDYSKLSPFWRLLISQDKSGLMREGDWRNWEIIRLWAENLVPLLEISAPVNHQHI